MFVAVTHDIRVSVEVNYAEAWSNPLTDDYAWTYTITIVNNGSSKVKLISRRWDIVDLLNGKKTVTGDGVVGLQPELNVGNAHTYTSGCQLHCPFGEMSGYYLFENLETGKRFEVSIPVFQLQLPFLLN